MSDFWLLFAGAIGMGPTRAQRGAAQNEVLRFALDITVIAFALAIALLPSCPFYAGPQLAGAAFLVTGALHFAVAVILATLLGRPHSTGSHSG